MESEDRIQVRSILKQKADSDAAKTDVPKQKSFADILSSKSNAVRFQFYKLATSPVCVHRKGVQDTFSESDIEPD